MLYDPENSLDEEEIMKRTADSFWIRVSPAEPCPTETEINRDKFRGLVQQAVAKYAKEVSERREKLRMRDRRKRFRGIK